jgi:hypothetical protein
MYAFEYLVNLKGVLLKPGLVCGSCIAQQPPYVDENTLQVPHGHPDYPTVYLIYYKNSKSENKLLLTSSIKESNMIPKLHKPYK